MGKVVLGEIQKLHDNWWTSDPPNDPAEVWKTWDRDTFYLWGANAGNYQGIPIGHLLGGDGMASVLKGPSRGRAHPHYAGIITMSKSDLPKNDPVFQALAASLAAGKTILFPTYQGKWSLGTGIGSNIPNWGEIQAYLLTQLQTLAQSATELVMPAGTYWPDLRPGHDGNYPLESLADIQKILQLLGAPHTAAAAAAAAPGDQLHPKPQAVQIGNTPYTLVAFYYPGSADPCDVTYNAGCFGNFFPCSITLDHPNPATGQKIVPTPKFHTAEAAFQALKWWAHDDIRQLFEAATTGAQVFAYTKGRNLPPGITLPTEDLGYAGLGRIGAMELVLQQKYTQPDLQAALLATGDAYLIEHGRPGSSDHFWNDNGVNMLGRTIMKIRGTLPGGKPAPAGTDNDTSVAQFKALL